MINESPETGTAGTQPDQPPFRPPPPGWQPGDDVHCLATSPISDPLWRRLLKWTVIGIALFVAFIVVFVAAAAIELIRALDRSSNGPSRPPRSQVIPVGEAAEIGDGWRLKVLRVPPSAERKASGAAQAYPPEAGTRYYLVKLAATYTGHGKGDPGALEGYGIEAVGAGGGTYDGSCLNYVPQPAFARHNALANGQTARGYICFEIDAGDAKMLLLHTGDFSDLFTIGMKGLHDRWFALR